MLDNYTYLMVHENFEIDNGSNLVYGSNHASRKATSFCYPFVYLSIKQLHESVLLFL